MRVSPKRLPLENDRERKKSVTASFEELVACENGGKFK